MGTCLPSEPSFGKEILFEFRRFFREDSIADQIAIESARLDTQSLNQRADNARKLWTALTALVALMILRVLWERDTFNAQSDLINMAYISFGAFCSMLAYRSLAYSERIKNILHAEQQVS